jgi:SAM-dependent methyltransferase
MSNLADNIIDLYERNALHWDAARRAFPLCENVWLDHFCSRISPGGAILDVGCGGGEPIARYLIEHGFEVTGVDSSATMISMCQHRFPKCSWLVGDMRTMALGKTFQGVVAWDSFFHLAHDDQRRMFPIFRKHLGSGGALLFTSGTDHGEAIGSYEGKPLYHASLSEAEYRSLLSLNGFAVTAHLAKDATCGHRTVWLAHLIG